MSKYRARCCPNCNYYVAFSVSKPLIKTNEAAVASFCLNCGYQLPMHAIVRGVRRVTSPLRRGALRLANISSRNRSTSDIEPRRQPENMKPFMGAPDYSRHLRALGRDLENLRLGTFNLECAENSYVVWARSSDAESEKNFRSFLKGGRLRKLWRYRAYPRSGGREEYVTVPPHRQAKRYRYALEDLDRMEHEARGRRRRKSEFSDGHSLSQLLRTVGALVSERGDRLLGISWQDLSVSIVVETAKGRREINVFRPDNLYDLWVRMYLQRENRAISDVPR